MTNKEENNELELDGILSQGYGIIPKKVMRDTRLSVEAKAIYAYLCSYSGHGNTAFPSVSLMCRDLGMGENRFYKHRKELIECGYIQITNRKSGSQYISNVYRLPTIPYLQNKGMENKGIKNKGMENKGTNNNNLINNSSINNNDENSSSKGNPYQMYQECFGILNPINQEDITYWIQDLGEELVLEAMKRAALDNKPYSWAVGMMKNWAKNNLTTLEDVEAFGKRYKNEKQQPPKRPKNNSVSF